jgi:hypothetical protein
MFKGRIDREFCQCGDGKRDIHMTQNKSTEKLTKEIAVTTSDSVSKKSMLSSAFVVSRRHGVKQFASSFMSGDLG